MIAVIGSGLGGLLSAAALSEKGYHVHVYEKLPFIGGRFTSIRYKGFEVSTGALHMIPHGKRGPLGKMLRKLGCDVEIVDSKPEAEILYKGERYRVTKKAFPIKEILFFYKELILSKLGKDKTMEGVGRSLDEVTYLFLKSFLGWSLSIFPDQIRLSKFYPIYKATLKYGGPGVPVGGCRAVIEELSKIIRANGGEIIMERVNALKPGDKVGVFGKNKKLYDYVISDIGHKLTAELLGEEYEKIPESRGVKFTIALNKPFIGHSGVLFTLGMSIAGMNEVTNVDENLGKKPMLQIHQPLRDGTKDEILRGLKEIKELLKGYQYEIIAIQSYKDDWPVNRVMAGMDRGNKTRYKNIFVVGDGAKGDDIEVDGVALGVQRVLEFFD
uniref:FAD-binding protein n=1 Tax=Geoglobus ahangari TaxID=113653 RepID=A0A7C4S5L2_9EURY